MDLKQQLTEDMKQSLRSGDKTKLGVLRFLLSDLKNFEIDNGPLDDAGVQKIIAKQVKQMKEAMADFERGGRADLVSGEQEKVAVLETYLPTAMSDAELTTLVDAVLADYPDATLAQMGEIMRAVMDKAQGSADGKRVSDLVKAKLAK